MSDEIKTELMPRVNGTVSNPEQAFADIMERAKIAVQDGKSIAVTDPADLRGMEKARKARLAIRAIRIEADKAHKELKADILRAGRAIDGMKNIVLQITEPEEKRLEDCEKLAERIQAQRDKDLQESRESELLELGENPILHGSLYPLSAEMWTHKINGIKAMIQAKKEAEEKARAEAEAKAKAEREEQERIRAENERLRKEAEEKEAQLKAEREAAEKARREAEELARKEREAIEAKAKAEREAAEKKAKEEADKLREAARAEAEARAKIEAERRAELAKQEAEKKAEADRLAKAAKAPDAEKLQLYLLSFAALELPALTSPEGKQMAADIAGLKAKYSDYIAARVAKLKGGV
jgi:myosin heavy subunit